MNKSEFITHIADQHKCTKIEAEKVIEKHQKIIDESKNKPTVNLDVEVEKKDLETRSSQSYNTLKKKSIRNLRNL